MKVTVNSKIIEIFDGATVEHAIRKFSPATLKAVKQGLLHVTDKFGNTIALSGSIAEGDSIHVQQTAK